MALGLSLKYAPAGAQNPATLALPYGRWEDLMRQKWTWDRVVRGSRGINCTGHCAFNVYVKNGIVWREEQQGEYGRSGDDTPDYGPRGCQKGLRQAKYMYGKQRVLYPMKREGARGEGKWERISWDQATSEIADKFIAPRRRVRPRVHHLRDGHADDPEAGLVLGAVPLLQHHRHHRARRPSPASATCRSAPT